MKKFMLPIFVALMAATVSFTSCEDDEDLVLSDIAGYAFAGKVGDGTYAITFAQSEQSFVFVALVANAPLTFTGTYSLSGTSVILTYPDGTTEELQSKGRKTLIYDGDIELKRQ